MVWRIRSGSRWCYSILHVPPLTFLDFGPLFIGGRVTQTYYIVEASHLFRAGDKHRQQIFVLDVVDWLQSKYFPGTEAKTTVLHGSVKNEQAARYAAALERYGAT